MTKFCPSACMTSGAPCAQPKPASARFKARRNVLLLPPWLTWPVRAGMLPQSDQRSRGAHRGHSAAVGCVHACKMACQNHGEPANGKIANGQ